MIQILFLLVVFILSPLVSARAVDVEVGSEAPDFTLSSVDGQTFHLSGSRDNVVLMIYWREDQKRSLNALEEIQTLHNRYGDRGVIVVSIVADTVNIDKLKDIIQEKGITYPVLIDIDRRVYGDYGVRVYPTTVIVDREGKVSRAIPGHAVTYQTMVDGYLRHALGEITEEQLQDAISPKNRELAGKEDLAAERKYNLALRFTETRLFDKAIEAAKGSLEAKPDVAKAHTLLGFLYLEEGEPEKAKGEFQKALELEPHSHDAQTGLGGAMIAQGEIDSAIDILKEAVQTNPRPQMAYYELGRAHELKGEKDRAIEMYKKAMDRIIRKNILPSSVSSCE